MAVRARVGQRLARRMDNLSLVVWHLAVSSEPVTVYYLSKVSRLPLSSVYNVLSRLYEIGHVFKTEDGRYTPNPKYFQVFGNTVVYHVGDGLSIIVTPELDSVDEVVSFISRLPASQKLQIFVDPDLLFD